jgi:2-methylcitrate dehydratase PrpD
MLAESAFTADVAILESPLGFLQAVVNPEDCDVADISERLGRSYVLEEALRIKRYPACSPGHPLIDAALRLVNDRKIDADLIQSIEADLRTFSLLRSEALDDESAGFSGAFLLAVSIIRGSFTLDELGDDAINDERVKALMKRIRHVPGGKSETITVFMRGGHKETVDVRPASRLSERAAIVEKFRRCVMPVIGGAATDMLERQILKLEAQSDVNRLMAAASGAAARSS